MNRSIIATAFFLSSPLAAVAAPSDITVTEHGRLSIETFGRFTMSAVVRPAPSEYPCVDTSGRTVIESAHGPNGAASSEVPTDTAICGRPGSGQVE